MDTDFEEGEKVLCFHGPLLYEARCTKVVIKDGAYHYFVHYNGWKNTWDEWVPKSRFLKFNEENLKLKKLLRDKHRKAIRRKPAAETEDSSPGSLIAKVLPSGSQTASQIAEKFLQLPQSLRTVATNDEHLVNNESMVVSLPKPQGCRVVDILNDFSTTMPLNLSLSGSEQAGMAEFTSSLSKFFEVVLGKRLLYRLERLQYVDLLQAHPDLSCCMIYGAEHLLRCLIQLTEEYGRLDHVNTESLVSTACFGCHLISYLQDNATRLFTMEYDNVPLDYYRRLNSGSDT